MRDLDAIYSEVFFESLLARSWRAPFLCTAIVKVLSPKRVMDVGCGTGDLVQYFKKLGVSAYGIECSRNAYAHALAPEKLWIVDLRNPLVNEAGFDLVTCFNVAEHIDVESTEIFIENLTMLGRSVLFAATSNDAFKHRLVNIRPIDEWKEMFEVLGFEEDVESVRRIVLMLGDLVKKPIIKMISANLILMRKK